MRISILTWSGIISLALGVTVISGEIVWMQTRTTEPIDMAISLRPGHVRTPEFSINMDSVYFINLEAKTRAGLPFDTVDCLLGATHTQNSCAQPSVLRAEWVLLSEGKVLEQGSSDPNYCCGSSFGAIDRQIGSFHSEKGRRYVLDLNILQDGSALAAADPHLNVAVSGDFAESAQILAYILFWPFVALIIYGLCILVSARVSYRRSKPSMTQ